MTVFPHVTSWRLYQNQCLRKQNTFHLKAIERASGYDQLIYSMQVQTGESSSPLSLLILALRAAKRKDPRYHRPKVELLDFSDSVLLLTAYCFFPSNVTLICRIVTPVSTYISQMSRSRPLNPFRQWNPVRISSDISDIRAYEIMSRSHAHNQHYEVIKTSPRPPTDIYSCQLKSPERASSSAGFVLRRRTSGVL